MHFKERDFVIANVQIKTPTNIVGGGNIMGFKIKDNVFDFVNNIEYPIIDDIDNIEQGVYAKILRIPFKNSKKTVSLEIFKDSEFIKYIKRKEKEHQEFLDFLDNNPEYVNKKNVCCSEDYYLYVEKEKKKKIFKKSP